MKDARAALVEGVVEEYAEQIVEYVELNLPQIMEEVEFPSRASLYLKRLAEGRKRKRHRLSREDRREKSSLIRSLHAIKFGKIEERGTTTSLESDGEGANDSVYPPLITRVAKEDGVFVPLLPDLTSFPIPVVEGGSSRTESQEVLKESHKTPLRKSPVRRVIERLKSIFPPDKTSKIRRVDRKNEEEFESFITPIEIRLKLNAREAFMTFLKAMKKIDLDELKVTPILSWTGETDLDSDELSEYMVKTMKTTGKGPKTKRGFSIVEAIQEQKR